MAAGQSPCVIGKGTRIKGNLTGAEDLVIEGAVHGHIHLKSHLTLTAGAEVKASIVADAVTVSGTIDGSVESKGVVALTREAVVSGDIKAPRVTIAVGAKFTGRIDMDVQLPSGV